MKSRYFRRIVLAFTVLFLSSICLVRAQSKTNPTGTGGVHEIRGRIYFPNGTAIDATIEIELQSTAYGTLKVTTDSGGSYGFTNLGPGNYTVVVNAGDQYEIARENVVIDPEVRTTLPVISRTRVFTVPVYLQPRRSNQSNEKTGVVNAKWSAIPKDAIHHYEKGNELAADKQLSKAEAEFRKSIEIAPSYTPAHTALGKLLLTQGKIPESVSELELAVRSDPNDFDARFSYGVALMNSKAIDRAQKEMNEAAALDKTAATPRYYLGLIFIQKKDLDDAQRELEAAKDLVGKKIFPLLHRYLGGVYVLKGMNKQAVAELEIYISQDPSAKDSDRIKQTISDLKNKM
jgi:Carboxypeptidase regulatory-like domain/Tetratricopeptide repeat